MASSNDIDIKVGIQAGTKPGWRTTEFWLSLLAMLIGALLASGVFSPDNPDHAQILRYIGFASTALGYMGYSVPRPFVKMKDSDTVARAMESKNKVPGLDR